MAQEETWVLYLLSVFAGPGTPSAVESPVGVQTPPQNSAW